MKKGLCIVFLLSFISFPVWSQTTGEYDLSYRYNVEGPIQYKMSMNRLEEKKFSGYASIPTQVSLTIQFTQENTSAEGDSLLRILMTFDKAEVMTRLPGRTMEPNTDVLNAQSVTAVITPKGEVSEMIGLALLPHVQIDPANIMGENLGDYLKQFFLELPEKPVKVGEKWQISKTDTTMEYGMTTISTTNVDMQFKGLKDRQGFECAQLVGKIKVDLTQSGQSAGSDISFEGDGKGKLEAFLAVKEGILVFYKGSQSIDGLITVKGTQNLEGTYSLENEAVYERNE